MSGPWEDYQAVPDGPWKDYATPLPASSDQGWMPYLADVAHAAGHSLAAEVGGIASTVKNVTGNETAKKIQDFADKQVDPNYVPANVYDQNGFHPWEIPKKIAEGAAHTAGIIGTSIAGASAGGAAGATVGGVGAVPGAIIGGLAAPFAYSTISQYGRNVDERAAKNNRDTATTEDKVAAIPGTVVGAGIDAVAGRVLGGEGGAVAKTGMDAVKRGLVTVGDNAALSAAGNINQQVGTGLGTEKGVNFDKNSLVSDTVTGGALGAGAALAHGVRDGASIYQNRGEPAPKQDLANLMTSDRVSGDPAIPKQREQVLKNTKAIVENDTKDAVNAVKDNLTDQQQQVIKDTQTNLKGGNALDAGQIETLKNTLSDPNHAPIVKNLLMRNELNKLAARKGTSLSETTDPTSGLGSMIKNLVAKKALAKGAAVVGTGLGFGAAPAAAVAGGLIALPKIGKMMITREPVGDFVNRFAGGPGTQMPAAPAPIAPQAPSGPVMPPGAGPWGPKPPTSGIPNIQAPQAPMNPALQPSQAAPMTARPAAPANPAADAITQAQAVLNDPTAHPALKAAAKQQIVQALMQGGKGVRSAPAAPQAPVAPEPAPQAPVAPRVTEPAPVAPEPVAAPEAPTPRSQATPDMHEFDTAHGTRRVAKDDIYASTKGYEVATHDNVATRQAIMDQAKNLKSISNEARTYLRANGQQHLNDLLGVRTREAAVEATKDFLSPLPKSDQETLNHHFQRATHEKAKFYTTWKHKDEASIAKAKERRARMKDKSS